MVQSSVVAVSAVSAVHDYVDGTHDSGIVSSAVDVLWMSGDVG